MKLALLTAGLVLVAGGAAGCGGDDPEPRSEPPASAAGTTTEDFCQAFRTFGRAMADASTDDPRGQIRAGKAAVVDLAEVGTPADASAQVSGGFDLFVRAVEQIPDDATAQRLRSFDQDFTASEKERFDALLTYVDAECTPTS